jgi:hypothetical protein
MRAANEITHVATPQRSRNAHGARDRGSVSDAIPCDLKTIPEPLLYV